MLEERLPGGEGVQVGLLEIGCGLLIGVPEVAPPAVPVGPLALQQGLIFLANLGFQALLADNVTCAIIR